MAKFRYKLEELPTAGAEVIRHTGAIKEQNADD